MRRMQNISTGGEEREKRERATLQNIDTQKLRNKNEKGEDVEVNIAEVVDTSCTLNVKVQQYFLLYFNILQSILLSPCIVGHKMVVFAYGLSTGEILSNPLIPVFGDSLRCCSHRFLDHQELQVLMTLGTALFQTAEPQRCNSSRDRSSPMGDW